MLASIASLVTPTAAELPTGKLQVLYLLKSRYFGFRPSSEAVNQTQKR